MHKSKIFMPKSTKVLKTLFIFWKGYDIIDVMNDHSFDKTLI
ncbi:hypothetical protein UF75_1645 [Desulfosporosinus sp. I2]|nr:hypothetical protein UF75_1645 [Desulfosporosinus sp. I2]